MAKFNKISCIVFAGLLLSGCAGKSVSTKVQANTAQIYSTPQRFSVIADLAKELAIKQGGAEYILHNVQQMITVRSIENRQTQEAQTDILQIKNRQVQEAQNISAGSDRSKKNGLKTEGWRIQTGCSKTTDALAQTVYQEVLGLEQELCEGIYEMKNSRMIFLTEKTEGSTVVARAVFEADYTSIRKPETDPLIQGMYEAKNELETDQERQAADEYIDGWLKEFYPDYQKTERIPKDIVIKFDTAHTKEYQLYYPFVKNSKEKLMPLRKYAMKYWKEDKEQRHQLGREILLSSINESGL